MFVPNRVLLMRPTHVRRGAGSADISGRDLAVHAPEPEETSRNTKITLANDYELRL